MQHIVICNSVTLPLPAGYIIVSLPLVLPSVLESDCWCYSCRYYRLPHNVQWSNIKTYSLEEYNTIVRNKILHSTQDSEQLSWILLFYTEMENVRLGPFAFVDAQTENCVSTNCAF